MGQTLLPKRLALPVFCSDPLSSNAYATEEMLRALSLGGLALFFLTPWVAAGVIVLLAVVVISYRQTCQAYPNGGGAYAVSRDNLGRTASLVAASALLIDYVLTVAVSVAAGVDAITSAFLPLKPHAVFISLGLVAVVALLNLRGVRESGTVFAIPTYGFIAVVFLMIGWGFWRLLFGQAPVAESAPFGITASHQAAGAAVLVLALRAFAQGCTALTGVEAVTNGVPHFQPPKSRNAASTLASMGGLTIAMFAGITALALVSHVRFADDPAQLVGAPVGYQQRTAIAQVAGAVFGYGSVSFLLLQGFTAAILVLAANTAFNGFPVLASILGRDGYLPRQFGRRGDRLVFSNGIVILAALAGCLIWAFDASTSRLIQLYIIGVFVSFTLSQAGMVRHWTKKLQQPASAGDTGAAPGPADQRRRCGFDRNRADRGVDHQVHPWRLPCRDCDAGPVPSDEDDQPALPPGWRRAGGRTSWGAAPVPRLRGSPGLQAAPADAAGPGLRPRDPSRLLDSTDGRQQRRRDTPAGGRVGRAQHSHSAHRHRRAVPRHHRPGAALRCRAAHRQSAHTRGGLHPRVRGWPLVGAAAAQPECAAVEGTAALPAGGDGDQRPLAPGVQQRCRSSECGGA